MLDLCVVVTVVASDLTKFHPVMSVPNSSGAKKKIK